MPSDGQLLIAASDGAVVLDAFGRRNIQSAAAGACCTVVPPGDFCHCTPPISHFVCVVSGAALMGCCPQASGPPIGHTLVSGALNGTFSLPLVSQDFQAQLYRAQIATVRVDYWAGPGCAGTLIRSGTARINLEVVLECGGVVFFQVVIFGEPLGVSIVSGGNGHHLTSCADRTSVVYEAQPPANCYHPGQIIVTPAS